MAVWSKLLSFKDPDGRRLHARPGRNQRSLRKGNLVVEDDIEEGDVNRKAVVVVSSVPRFHSRGIGTLPFGNEANSSPPSQAGFLRSGMHEAPFLELIGENTASRPLENPGQRNSYRQCCPLVL